MLGYFIGADLQEPANISQVPNPVKSAWFLLWIQEIVSYSVYTIYIIIFLFVIFFFLPYLSKKSKNEIAEWFGKDNKIISLFTIIILLIIIALTIIAFFFRGENWELVSLLCF